MTTKEDLGARFRELLEEREIFKNGGDPDEWVEIHMPDGKLIRCKSLLFVAYDVEGHEKDTVTGAAGAFSLIRLLRANEAFMELTQKTGSYLLKLHPERYGAELEKLNGHVIKKILKDILDTME